MRCSRGARARLEGCPAQERLCATVGPWCRCAHATLSMEELRKIVRLQVRTRDRGGGLHELEFRAPR